MNSKSGYPEKIAAVKELHNLVKTKCLLLRDLPFITRISKYYDLTLFDNIISGSSKHLLNILILEIIKFQKINLIIKIQLKIIVV